MRSPFIQGDFELLQESHQVRPFDLGKHAASFRQVPNYLIDVLSETLQIAAADVVWIWFADYPAAPLVVMAKVFRKPVVVNVGGFEVSGIPEIGYGNQLSTIRGAVSRWIIRNIDVTIVPSEVYARKVVEVEPLVQRVETIPNWIDIATCDELLPDKADIVVTAVCSKFAYQYKGIPIFKAVEKAIPYKTRIIENLPRSMYELILKRSKVYCQLSRDETFGISLVEAMAYGCVPVVSDKGALPWIVGNAGLIVPYGDVLETVAAIKQAMNMNGNLARERARYFSRERKREAIADVVSDICDQKY
jgi:hypothetical protein